VHKWWKLWEQISASRGKVQQGSTVRGPTIRILLCPRPGCIKRWRCLASVWRLSVCLPVAYIGNNSRIERPRKTKIGAQVAHVTHDSDTISKDKMLKVKVTRALCLDVLAGQHGHTVMVTYPYAYMTYIVSPLCRPGRGISWRPPAYSLFSQIKYVYVYGKTSVRTVREILSFWSLYTKFITTNFTSSSTTSKIQNTKPANFYWLVPIAWITQGW